MAASRGLGVGSAMLKAVQNFAIGCGLTRLRLTTAVDNLAVQRVYEQAGRKKSTKPGLLNSGLGLLATASGLGLLATATVNATLALLTTNFLAPLKSPKQPL